MLYGNTEDITKCIELLFEEYHAKVLNVSIEIDLFLTCKIIYFLFFMLIDNPTPFQLFDIILRNSTLEILSTIANSTFFNMGF